MISLSGSGDIEALKMPITDENSNVNANSSFQAQNGIKLSANSMSPSKSAPTITNLQIPTRNVKAKLEIPKIVSLSPEMSRRNHKLALTGTNCTCSY